VDCSLSLNGRARGDSSASTLELARILGEWVVLESERSSHRKIRLWSFRSFSEAEEFRFRRKEFYRIIGLEQERILSPALPDISQAEMELFERIVANPEWLSLIMRQFAR
jgi:hypothetical protein